MYHTSKDEVPRRLRNGLTSFFLLDRNSNVDHVDHEAASNLAVTWVEVEPGAAQIPHHHAPEQIYVIVQGSGLMRVGEETQQVTAGDLVFIPPHAVHGLQNNGADVLIYVSAATPPFDLTEAYDRGQLQAQRYLEESGG
ncbi:MAG: cupin domain-containing protein [Anaerolineales bacterium]|nr:cupin domain-containing protein [Anaerolineales bacterium]